MEAWSGGGGVEACALVGRKLGRGSEFPRPGRGELRAPGLSGMGGDEVVPVGGFGAPLPTCSEVVLEAGPLGVDAA